MTDFGVACSACGRPVGLGDSFCGGCGVKLAATDTAEAGSDRRQLTVMFCDLVGSTEMAADLDPEDVQAIMRTYQQTAADIVHNMDGYVAQYLGDGMLIYFGYPVAHEDDPVRAVSAALEIAREVPALSAGLRAAIVDLGPADLAVRIGIHTGPVVIGTIGSTLRRERLASGPTINLAARLAAAAVPGATVVSNVTAQRVTGVFELADLGCLTLKGIIEPVATWQPLRMRGMQSRIATWTAGSGRPIVGRDALIAELMAAWETVCTGQTRAIVLRGEAGIGKTRLVQALRQRLGSQRHGWIACYGSLLQRSDAFRPVIEAVRASLGLDDDAPPALQRALLGSALALIGFDQQDVVDRLGRLLGIASTNAADPTVDERARTIEAMAEWWLRLARRQPMVMAVEDVHWLDPSTIELLTTMLDRADGEPVLMLGTVRPDSSLPWGDRVRIIDVGALDAVDTEAIVRSVLGEVDASDDRIRALTERCDGVPLYAEELARALIDQASDPIRADAIPGSLQDSLTARLDRLGGNKRLAQIGALLGRSFPYELLAAVSGLDGKTLRSELDELVRRQILLRDGVLPRATFTFHHALLQDAAAGSMLRQRRREEHRRIADILLTIFPDQAADHPSLVAHHFAEAGEIDTAITWFARSGARATARAEFREAIADFAVALSHLQQLPDGPERDAREIELRLDSGVPHSMASSFGDSVVGAAYRRAHELSRAASQPAARHFEALYGVARYAMVAGELDNAVAACGELLAYSELTGSPAHALAAQVTLGQVVYWQGHFGRSDLHCQRALLLCEHPEAEALHVAAAVHPRVSAGIFGSWAQWALGKPDAARQLADDALAFARSIDDYYSHGIAAGFGSVNAIMLLEPERARRLSAEALAVSDRHAIPLVRGMAMVCEGWARAVIDSDAGGLAEVERGMALLASVGSASGAPGTMSIMADVHARLGNPHAARAIAQAALDMAQKTGQYFYDAELHRLVGCAQMAISGPDDLDAELAFQRAIASSRQQGAISLELRSAVSLARMFAARGCRDKARDTVLPVLARFPDAPKGAECTAAQALLSDIAAQ